MAANSQLRAIDADGHVMERRQDIELYLDDEYKGRNSALWPSGQPWDADYGGKLGFGEYGYKRKMGPAEQVDYWHRIMDEYDMETAVLFPTGSGNMMKLQEPGFAEAAIKAVNKHFANDFKTDRLKPVGVLPMANPQAAIEELRRVKASGLVGVEVLTDGLHFALGNPCYDPIYAEAEKLGIPICIHGTRNQANDWGSSKLSTFAEVHCFAFPAGMMLQMTSVLMQGVPVKFPKLRIAFLETGITWMPFYLARMDEHWHMRGEREMPVLKKKPSDVFRESEIICSLEADEPLLAETIDFIGVDHVVFASDIPHWDGEFPGNIQHIRGMNEIDTATKEKILYSNAKRFFQL